MNFMEFSWRENPGHAPRVEPWILEELGYHLQLFYTRKKRDSNGHRRRRRSALQGEAVGDHGRAGRDQGADALDEGCLLEGG